MLAKQIQNDYFEGCLNCSLENYMSTKLREIKGLLFGYFLLVLCFPTAVVAQFDKFLDIPNHYSSSNSARNANLPIFDWLDYRQHYFGVDSLQFSFSSVVASFFPDSTVFVKTKSGTLIRPEFTQVGQTFDLTSPHMESSILWKGLNDYFDLSTEVGRKTPIKIPFILVEGEYLRNSDYEIVDTLVVRLVVPDAYNLINIYELPTDFTDTIYGSPVKFYDVIYDSQNQRPKGSVRELKYAMPKLHGGQMLPFLVVPTDWTIDPNDLPNLYDVGRFNIMLSWIPGHKDWKHGEAVAGEDVNIFKIRGYEYKGENTYMYYEQGNYNVSMFCPMDTRYGGADSWNGYYAPSYVFGDKSFKMESLGIHPFLWQGEGNPVSVNEDQSALMLNYVNASESAGLVKVNFMLLQSVEKVSVTILSATGQEIFKRKLQSTVLGENQIQFSSGGMSSGVYVVRIQTDIGTPVASKFVFD